MAGQLVVQRDHGHSTILGYIVRYNVVVTTKQMRSERRSLGSHERARQHSCTGYSTRAPNDKDPFA